MCPQTAANTIVIDRYVVIIVIVIVITTLQCYYDSTICSSTQPQPQSSPVQPLFLTFSSAHLSRPFSSSAIILTHGCHPQAPSPRPRRARRPPPPTLHTSVRYRVQRDIIRPTPDLISLRAKGRGFPFFQSQANPPLVFVSNLQLQ